VTDLMQLTLDNSEALVAFMPDAADFKIALEQHWYRIPVREADKLLEGRWPPVFVAFRFSSKFGADTNCIRHYARVTDIQRASRSELFPTEPQPGARETKYYKLILSPLEAMPNPVIGERWVWYPMFISTTSAKLFTAKNFNDLFDASPLEDLLAAQLELAGITVQRQHMLVINGRKYSLDFAIFCQKVKIDVETDGDLWHQKKTIVADNLRSNDLASTGWTVLRFNTKQILDSMDSYCVPIILEAVKNWGGLKAANK